MLEIVVVDGAEDFVAGIVEDRHNGGAVVIFVEQLGQTELDCLPAGSGSGFLGGDVKANEADAVLYFSLMNASAGLIC